MSLELFSIGNTTDINRFHCRAAATANALSPCLSLVRGINISPLSADRDVEPRDLAVVRSDDKPVTIKVSFMIIRHSLSGSRLSASS